MLPNLGYKAIAPARDGANEALPFAAVAHRLTHRSYSAAQLVIPVLAPAARMPRPDELLESIRPLTTRQAVRLTHDRLAADVAGLVKSMQETFDLAMQYSTATKLSGELTRYAYRQSPCLSSLSPL